MLARLTTVLVSLVLVIAGCSSSGSESADTAGTDQLPAALNRFDRLCESQTGFVGASAYEPGAGPHPIVVLEALDRDAYAATRADLPTGWSIDSGELSGTDADAELFEAIELVACVEISQTTEAGLSCRLQSFDGETVDLEALNGSFDLTIYEAATGSLVDSMPITSEVLECPNTLTIDEGQTEFLFGPSADDYEELLRPIVEPG